MLHAGVGLQYDVRSLHHVSNWSNAILAKALLSRRSEALQADSTLHRAAFERIHELGAMTLKVCLQSDDVCGHDACKHTSATNAKNVFQKRPSEQQCDRAHDEDVDDNKKRVELASTRCRITVV